METNHKRTLYQKPTFIKNNTIKKLRSPHYQNSDLTDNIMGFSRISLTKILILFTFIVLNCCQSSGYRQNQRPQPIKSIISN
jgi:hypothetical protein